MKKFKNYVLFYGSGNEEKLSEYDLAIVEPMGQDNKTIQYLKDHNTTVLAYISFLEVHPMSNGYHLLQAEDYLTDQGQIIENHAYHTKLVSLHSERWQSILLNHIHQLVALQHYDGIFIDTLADIEYFDFPDEIRNSLINGVIPLMQRIKECFPKLIIVQNNGFEYIYRYTASYIDGICIENPIILTRSFMDMLRFLHEKHEIEVLLLTNHQSDAKCVKKLSKAAMKHGYLHYHASIGYEHLS